MTTTDLSCLTRVQREEIATCFLENESCNEAMKQAPAKASEPASFYVTTLLAGIVIGFIAAAGRR